MVRNRAGGCRLSWGLLGEAWYLLKQAQVLLEVSQELLKLSQELLVTSQELLGLSQERFCTLPKARFRFFEEPLGSPFKLAPRLRPRFGSRTG